MQQAQAPSQFVKLDRKLNVEPFAAIVVIGSAVGQYSLKYNPEAFIGIDDETQAAYRIRVTEEFNRRIKQLGQRSWDLKAAQNIAKQLVKEAYDRGFAILKVVPNTPPLDQPAMEPAATPTQEPEKEKMQESNTKGKRTFLSLSRYNALGDWIKAGSYGEARGPAEIARAATLALGFQVNNGHITHAEREMKLKVPRREPAAKPVKAAPLEERVVQLEAEVTHLKALTQALFTRLGEEMPVAQEAA